MLESVPSHIQLVLFRTTLFAVRSIQIYLYTIVVWLMYCKVLRL